MVKKEIFLGIILFLMLLIIPLMLAEEDENNYEWSPPIGTEFDVNGPDNVPMCKCEENLILENQCKWWIVAGSSYSFYDCKRANGVDEFSGAKSECCPAGYSCDLTSNQCVATKCSDFKTQVECEGDEPGEDHPDVAKGEIKGADSSIVCNYISDLPTHCNCHEGRDCYCKWDGLEGCKASAEHTYDGERDSDITVDLDSLCGCSSSGTGIKYKKCVYTFTYGDDCSTQGTTQYTRSWTVKFVGNINWINPPWCKGGNDIVLCPETPKLSFFGIFNFIAALLGIAFIYYFYKKQHKKKTCKK